MFPLVFLVQDDASPALRGLLRDHHYAVHLLPCSETQVLESAEKRRPALFLIDAPLEASLALCQAIRRDPRLGQTPVLLVSQDDSNSNSNSTSEDDRIRGFEMGADDFLVKPLRPREVAARINALVRRSTYRQPEARVEVGGVEVDTERFLLTVQGTRVEATATQVRLVEYLMRNQGRVFSRDQILDAVWSDARFVTPRTIDVHIRRIRELIEPNPAKPMYLKTVRGAGYCFASQNEPQRRPREKERDNEKESRGAPEWFPGASGRPGVPLALGYPPARVTRVS